MVNQAPTSSDMEEKPSSKRVKSEDDHVAKEVKTEEDHYGSKSLDTAKADKLVWLMKLPQTVAKSWNSHPSSDPHPFAKVALSLDPLETDKTSSVQLSNLCAGDHNILKTWMEIQMG
ncbi:putative transcription initiation factor IIF, beta subunit [Rosa chinensis]|uniref:Putative transcription initiation factor IIF, beta subunit n=1 Tax=Rosa chinensis TaxID=74649 RepID=A0A2P6RPX2_ROSCH|nr:putative transcription initiation factor IIF, beta subunit [Rosa chinensis]